MASWYRANTCSLGIIGSASSYGCANDPAALRTGQTNIPAAIDEFYE
jgi:hypothetical protein